jgi:molecular chaperone GrpE
MTDTEQATPEQVAREREAHEQATAAPRPEPTGEAEQAQASVEGTPARESLAAVADAAETEAEEVLRGDVDELLATVAKRDEYLALAQRTQADFENYRKRVARDLAAAQERGVGKLARELLPALDNLDRALEAAEPGDPLLEGVRLVRAELAAALGRVGIESFAPDGEPFDPEQHEAIVQRPVDGVESGRIAEVYQAGYRLNGTIIRPARVVVAA